MKEQTNMSRRISVRFTQAEFTAIEKDWKASTCKKLSDYLRRIMQGKPIVKGYRNKSMDDFMAELIRLRAELNAAGNNFNQVVKRLHTYQSEDSIKASLLSYEMDRRQFLKHVEAIQSFIEKQAGLW